MCQKETFFKIVSASHRCVTDKHKVIDFVMHQLYTWSVLQYPLNGYTKQLKWPTGAGRAYGHYPFMVYFTMSCESRYWLSGWIGKSLKADFISAYLSSRLYKTRDHVQIDMLVLLAVPWQEQRGCSSLVNLFISQIGSHKHACAGKRCIICSTGYFNHKKPFFFARKVLYTCTFTSPQWLSG